MTDGTPAGAPSGSPRVLVVDDEPQMLSIVSFALETQGFECVTAPSAESAWRILAEQHVDLIVLDIMLPGASGVELCRRVRSHHRIPVMLLTARGEVDDRVRGLEAGADDYVVKPFSPRELALRAQAVMRRTGAGADDGLVRNGPLTVDTRIGEVTYGQRRLEVSETEARLLAALAERAGEVVTWRELLNEVWATSSPIGGRQMVKTSVYRLRQRLASGLGLSTVIETVRGAGYAMVRLDTR